MPTVKSSLGEGTQSVLLTVAILEHLARDAGPLSISDLAREIDASKSRIFRHLQTLASADFISHDPDTGAYDVGNRLLEICSALGQRHDILGTALPILNELKEDTRHTAIISRVSPSGVHVLSSVAADSPIVLAVREGSTLPFGRSAQGLVALAFLPVPKRAAGGPFAEAHARIEADDPGLLHAIRSQGWAEARMREGLSGKAAPVLDPAGRLVATIALLNTEGAMTKRSEEDTTNLLKAAGRLEDGLRRASFRTE